MTSNEPRGPATPVRVAVIGGGPAGLMAAQVLCRRGVRVDLFDAMPSVGRKFLLAGKGGLNLTHGEDFDAFVTRFGAAATSVEPLLRRFGPTDVRAWAEGLSVATFTGTSGRVFPVDLKAAPLLRAWLHRLRADGVAFHMRHRWTGWAADAAGPADEAAPRAAGSLRFSTPTGEIDVAPDAVVFALGGASWPQLGSDGAWVALLEGRGVAVTPLQPSNCGFDVAGRGATEAEPTSGWSEHFRTRFAGSPLKNVALSLTADAASSAPRIGEFVVT